MPDRRSRQDADPESGMFVRASTDGRAFHGGHGLRVKGNFNLTNRRVAELEVDRRDAFFWDRDLPGFGVRVYRNGRKVYVVQARGPGGATRRTTIGSHLEIGAERARGRARVVIDRIKQGLDPVPRPELTVADLAERYLDVHVAVNCRPSTQETFRRLVDKYILPELGDLPVTAVDRSHVAALHYGLHEKPYQANQAVRVLAKMFKLGEAWGMVPPRRSPCRSIRYYREHRRERYLTAEEYRRLGRVLAEAEADGSVFPSGIAAIRLLLLTGCRKNEILTLRWDDIDRTARELRLSETKTGPRRVPLTPAVERVLERIPRIEGNPWVIAGRKEGDRLKNLDAIWHRLRARAGLKDVRIHDFRHSFSSRALALGESMAATAALLGHRKIATTARYAHLSRDAEKSAIATIGRSMGADLGVGTKADPLDAGSR